MPNRPAGPPSTSGDGNTRQRPTVRGRSEYDRALARHERAIATAEEARAIAREDAPDRVPDAEAVLNDATALRETIQAKRDARKRTTDALDTAEGALDDAAAALDGGSPEAVLDRLDGVAESLDTASASIEDHEFPTLAERVATLEQRQERLRQAAREARTWVPAEIPGVTRHSLSTDIERRGELGWGGNADVYHATAATDRGPVDLALKQLRMGGGCVAQNRRYLSSWTGVPRWSRCIRAVSVESVGARRLGDAHDG